MEHQQLQRMSFREYISLGRGFDPKSIDLTTIDPAEFGRRKAAHINAQEGDLTGYHCPKCKNKGWIACSRDDGTLFFTECTCKPIRRCIRKMEESGLKDIIRKYTFEAFTTEKPWQAQAKQIAQDFAKDPQGWFLACGQSGSGKTHLCTAVCRELLLSGRELHYMPWRQEIGVLKQGEFSQRQAMMEELKAVEVLYIDDLFKIGSVDGNCQPTSADVSLAFELLNHRYVNALTTILSTELLPEELLKIDEATVGRILEAAGNSSLIIARGRDRNYRLRRLQPL